MALQQVTADSVYMAEGGLWVICHYNAKLWNTVVMGPCLGIIK